MITVSDNTNMKIKSVISLCVMIIVSEGGNNDFTFVLDESISQNKLITDSRLIQHSKADSSQCAVECRQNERCIMFAMAPSLKSCQLYYDEVTETSNNVYISANISYYKAWCTDQPGYLYYRTIKQCMYRQRVTKMNFTMASQDCWENRGTLLEPRTADLLTFLAPYTSKRFWIGAFGDSMTRTWHWLTGGDISSNSSLWLSDKPSGDFENLCVEAKPQNRKYGYNDRNCTYEREFFCQLLV